MSNEEITVYKSRFLKKCIVKIKEKGYPETSEVLRELKDMEKLINLDISKNILEDIKRYLVTPLDIVREGTSLSYKSVDIVAKEYGIVTNNNLKLLKEDIKSYQDIRRFVENVFRVPDREDSDIIYRYSVDMFHKIMEE